MFLIFINRTIRFGPGFDSRASWLHQPNLLDKMKTTCFSSPSHISKKQEHILTDRVIIDILVK